MGSSDVQWARIEPLLPDRTPRRGGRWRDHRQVTDAVAFRCRTGTPWMNLPAEFRFVEGPRMRRGRQGGRPRRHDREACKQHNTVERCINCLKQWRGLTTRYDANATICRAGLVIAAVHIRAER
ncbi:transposase [Yinghuangia aomiensis]